MSESRVIVVAGPTASGKSALAIDLAKSANGVVINADSMQVYKGLPIITACPSVEERAAVEHRLFEIYDCGFRGNVVDWLERAVAEIKKVWSEGKVSVVVGGTGLYLDNLIHGTTPIPETSREVRLKVAQLLQENGNAEIYRRLQEVDPESAQKLNINDTTRIVRALEVYEDTGIKLSEWHTKPLIRKLPEAHFLTIKICPSVEELDQRCYIRLDKMIQEGALAEIKELDARGLDDSLPAMKALGVPELLNYVRGNCPLPEALAAAKLHTRQYAKRQRTWFRNKMQADFELDACYQGDLKPLLPVLQQFGFK